MLTTDQEQLAGRAVELARTWVTRAQHEPLDRAGLRLARLLADPGGLPFTLGFVDGVIRPHDPLVAARNLSVLARKPPQFLGFPLREALRAGGVLSHVAPHLVVPVARRLLRSLVSHLLIETSPGSLAPSLADLRAQGVHLNINLLSEAVLGPKEAARRLAAISSLLRRGDVDYVSVKVSSIVAPHNRWANRQMVDEISAALRPLLRIAEGFSPHKFLNFDMEEAKDFDLTLKVFTSLLSEPEFVDLEAGIVLQAYLPGAYPALVDLQKWARDRVGRGGAPIRIRLVKGANLPMEQVESQWHGWPLPTWPTKAHTDAAYKVLLDYALRPEHTQNIRVGVAGHNVFDIAYAHLLAAQRGVSSRVEFEMLLGMAPNLARVISRDVGRLRLYTPVVDPAEFDVAIAYLVRRLDEAASPENFMSAVYEMGINGDLFAREEKRFRRSLDLVQDLNFTPMPPEPGDPQEFFNTPDTNPDLPSSATWAQPIFETCATSTLGRDLVAKHTVETGDELDAILATAHGAGARWHSAGANFRASILRKAAVIFEQRRGAFLEVMASECAKTLNQGDPEVSEAVDFARYYARMATDLEEVREAKFTPARLVVVTPPWNFPLAIAAGSTLAALAAGAAVILKPARAARRCGALLAQALWDAGVPRDVLRLCVLKDPELGGQLITSPRVDRVILTGGYETAARFKSLRPDLFLLAETSGKNAIIVTPHADYDLAAKDIASSAFGHAGQKCSAASLVILVGSVAQSTRFRNQLLDATAAMRVGLSQAPESQIGPIIEPPKDKLLRGLTKLGPGEHWALEPKPLNLEATLWSPGIRSGVVPGSDFHQTEFFGPILGIMTAATLDQAMDLVNATHYGLTSGLHSLDVGEMERWLATIAAGNLYINRTITGAIVRRQPFGGWKRSSIGPGSKAGGPNYLYALGSWEDSPTTEVHDASHTRSARRTLDLERLDPQVQGLYAVTRSCLGHPCTDWLETALLSDLEAHAGEFSQLADPSGLTAEQNILRYLPVPVVVWLETGPGRPFTKGLRTVAQTQLIREVAAGILAGSDLAVNVPDGVVSPQILGVISSVGVNVTVRPADRAFGQGAVPGPRLRLITPWEGAGTVGQNPSASEVDRLRRNCFAAAGVDTAVYAGDVVTAGRVTGLTYLAEQAISITAHRFGTPSEQPRFKIADPKT